MLRTSHCHVTVSLPYYQCKQHVRKAVESILGQTHPDLTLVVVNDGDDDPPWDQLADIHDPRLVKFDLQSNHGEYFTHAVVLGATEAPYFLIQDAGDWSEPERLSVLLEIIREDHSDAAISAEYQYSLIDDDMVSKVKKTYPAVNRSLTHSFENRASHHGLFKSSSLREIGGTYGGFCTGYGVLLIHFLLMIGRISYIDDPLYHRVIKFGSTTQSMGARMTAVARMETAGLLEKLYHEAFASYIEYLSGRIELETLAESIRQICKSVITQKDLADLIEETNNLRATLATCIMSERASAQDGHSAEFSSLAQTRRPGSMVANCQVELGEEDL